MNDTITKIGLLAGGAWHFVDDKGGESVLSEVVNSLKGQRDYVLMAIGWLAREGQLFLEDNGKDIKITRKKW